MVEYIRYWVKVGIGNDVAGKRFCYFFDRLTKDATKNDVCREGRDGEVHKLKKLDEMRELYIMSAVAQ